MYQKQPSMDYHEQQHWAPGSSGQQQGWLEAGGKVMAEYIYIANPVLGQLESKTVVLEHGRPHSVDALPSVELQTETGEVYLQPRSIYADPLRGGEHILVLCEAFVPPQFGSEHVQPQPHEANTRASCAEVMAAAAAAQPAFSLEQEYAVLDPFTGLPPGVFPASVPVYVPGGGAAGSAGSGAHSHPSCCESGSTWGSPAAYHTGGSLAASLSALPGGAAAQLLLQGPPQHPRGSPAARRARQLSELHMRACIKAGLRYSGSSALGGGCCDSCWAYKIGPCVGVDAGDQLSVSRFLLRRIGEELDVGVSLGHQKGGAAAFGETPSDWGGAMQTPGACSPLACSVEFSTATTRCLNGDAMGETQRMLSRLQASHAEHSAGYAGPSGNTHRTTRATSAFTVAVGDRRASISIPSSTLAARSGPFVDRRPAADCDVYLTTALLTAGALGLPLPLGAARALADRRSPPGSVTRTPSASAPVPMHSGPSAAFNPSKAAAELLLKQQQQQGGIGIGGLAAALNAAVAAGRLQIASAAAAAPAPQPSALAGDSFGSASGCDDEDLCGSEDEGSVDVLISEIRRIDRQARRRAPKPRACASGLAGGWEEGASGSDDDDSEDEEDDSACSAMASAASSPDCGGPLAAACASADVDMLMG